MRRLRYTVKYNSAKKENSLYVCQNVNERFVLVDLDTRTLLSGEFRSIGELEKYLKTVGEIKDKFVG